MYNMISENWTQRTQQSVRSRYFNVSLRNTAVLGPHIPCPLKENFVGAKIMFPQQLHAEKLTPALISWTFGVIKSWV